ncbi:hypothetical protein [Bradyrhizobium sp. CCBAU 53338]|uniref:hypothetical protein n=1 Tax=Bradyrhizobium sp. CCBAU 53338 TaxID=1325111 RepID=UPI00188B4223|nr:hypothetical protein [Bradyrhizobium sp. CCBAU 53338]
MDEVPLFLSAIPISDIGARAVLKVRVTELVGKLECLLTQPSADKPTIHSSISQYARAEVLSVERGFYAGRIILLCASKSIRQFVVGDSGLVFGPISANGNGEPRLMIAESYRQMVDRRRREGAACVWKYCVDFWGLFRGASK